MGIDINLSIVSCLVYINPFPHTTNRLQTTLKTSTQKYGKSINEKS